MSFSIGAVSLQSFRLGAGMAPRALAVSDCTKMEKPPAVVTLPINWADYGGAVGQTCLIDVDLNILGAALPIDKLRSVYIDNSFSDQDVYVYFPDTQMTIICPANSTLISPVWTNGLKAQLYASGFANFTVPSTTFQFSNIPKDTASVVTSQSVIRKSITRSAFVQGTTAFAAAKTFNLVDMGAFSPFGAQYILVGGRRSAAGALLLNTVTVNGVNCTKLAFFGNAAGETVNIMYCPQNFAGQLTTIIATYNSTVSENFIAVMASFNLSAPATVFASFGAVLPPVSVLATPAGGVAMAINGDATNPAVASVMSGILNINSFIGVAHAGGTGYQPTSGAPLQITAVGTATIGAGLSVQ